MKVIFENFRNFKNKVFEISNAKILVGLGEAKFHFISSCMIYTKLTFIFVISLSLAMKVTSSIRHCKSSILSNLFPDTFSTVSEVCAVLIS